ncbi:MAG: adenylyl-sulfate kinase [Candidatus Staskawiczbacteria bacterium]|nr:adenylyl-sulfate kinase [Candidatus Staskawiczbacteria bacterium]
MVIWFTGLSGSGKSTLSNYLKEALDKAGFSVLQVDGDVVRQQNKKERSFKREDIIENNHKIISYCHEIEKDYDFIIVAVISPYQQTRNKAREIFGKEYMEIFLNCPLEVLVKNDVKNLYEKAKKGEIKNMIGFSENSPYETPKSPDLEIRTDKIEIGKSIELILELLKKHGTKI